jgi:hypothetical protein
MIKKIFTSILVLNIILINIAINFLVPKIEINLELTKKVVDIKNTNDLINTYSNLIMEIVPANE